MGIYLNPGNDGFKTVRAGKYVDKSGMIAVINDTIGKDYKLSLVSRARRFGKSYAAKMLCAYYDCSCDSAPLFDDLNIAKDPSYRVHLNQYNVFFIDITGIIGVTGSIEEILPYIQKKLYKIVSKECKDVEESDSVIDLLDAFVKKTGRKCIAIIDEWDAVMRDPSSTSSDIKRYLEFLRSLFKNSVSTDRIFAAAYMTGILPVKKDGSQSAISAFREYTMLAPREFEEYVGFTDEDVRVLCDEYNMDYDEMKRWYDGYSFRTVHSVYNPNSVMYALRNKQFESYWAMSSSANSLLDYINMDFDGLSEAAADLLGGKSIPINVRRFKNDLTSLASKDDVLTLLTHYGYLSYDADSETVRIPNQEIRDEFSDMIHDVTHEKTIQRVKDSIALMEASANGDSGFVADMIEKIHRQECAPLHYNNEQALCSVIKMAFFAYRDHYLQFEELPGGNGYADIVYLPKKYSDHPALIIELKWQDSPDAAINQIKQKHYPDLLADFEGRINLVGISYDKDDPDKKHSCEIEILD